MAGHAAPNIVEDGLVFYVDPANPRSYISGSLDTFSLINPSITGSIHNDVSYSFNNAGIWEFDGTDDNIDISQFNLTGNWTISFWFNVPAYDASIQYALGFELGTGLDGGIFTDYSGVYANKWGFYRGNAVYPADSALSVGNWHNCVVTRTGNDLAFYVDGVADGTDTNTDSMDIVNFRIGERTDGNWELNGSLSNIQIYNRVLSSTEVKQNYNALKGRFI
jgi:hypothetical protein